MTDHATHTLATLRATIRRLALPASFALQPEPNWDELITEQEAWLAAHPEPVQPPGGDGTTPCSDPHPEATTTRSMPARALRHARRTGWEEMR